MRFAMAQPCLGSSEMVFRIKRSSVPWTRSFGFDMLWLSTTLIVDCQGMTRKSCDYRQEPQSGPTDRWFVSSLSLPAAARAVLGGVAGESVLLASLRPPALTATFRRQKVHPPPQRVPRQPTECHGATAAGWLWPPEAGPSSIPLA